MNRDQFREAVFARDNHKCVVCGAPAQDAHHILERRLWETGGYFLANGASLCGSHHMDAEKTVIQAQTLRDILNIETVLPEHLYDDLCYDKWGNILNEDGSRTPGELFYDESVQKVLKDVLHEFRPYIKYPRTYHLPWSPGMNDDDRMMKSMDSFKNQEVIVTEKMDGENTTMYSDYIHARSIDGRSHPSRDWVKNFHSQIKHDIPKGWRICGENLFAEHSIHYKNLPGYFMGFSIWNERNICLDWDTTQEWFELLGIPSVPVLYRGVYDEMLIKGLKLNEETSEGYVVRKSGDIAYRDHRNSYGKYVRANHIQTTRHWMYGSGRQLPSNELGAPEIFLE